MTNELTLLTTNTIFQVEVADAAVEVEAAVDAVAAAVVVVVVAVPHW